jgi:hypothetical protein
MARPGADPAVSSPLLTAREAMAYLRCGRSFLHQHADEIGVIRYPGKLLFATADLDRYIASKRVQTPVARPTPTPIRDRPAAQHRHKNNPLTQRAWSR